MYFEQNGLSKTRSTTCLVNRIVKLQQKKGSERRKRKQEENLTIEYVTSRYGFQKTHQHLEVKTSIFFIRQLLLEINVGEILDYFDSFGNNKTIIVGLPQNCLSMVVKKICKINIANHGEHVSLVTTLKISAECFRKVLHSRIDEFHRAKWINY